ncbi:endolytic transglycosylase MltG [Parvularcula dongshanensis]|uniref:Endolytic murein transglycosylase n=1 Tax=Parvularcula dongshanensis TaxID=1173995 RepID=A0A840I791_9PROT|nr:endolytic transglycosylase MltG [Parvularcula dongshanensis]MBB4660131.1 UPF0755 protein [Parvularcula dongshanensis]
MTVSGLAVRLAVDACGLPEAYGAELFRFLARYRALAPSLRAGEFEIPQGASLDQIVRTLRDAKPLLRFVTVPEGRTTAQVLRIVEAAPVLEGEVTLAPAEGALLPETYAYERGEPRDAVVRRMMEAHDAALAELWPGRAEGLPIDTPEEAVVLASIVEKETALAAERPRVAAVFVNRLNKGMRLQSDPTIIYGLTGGEPLGRGIRLSELRGETPYNTYVIRGLPPTPIANPGHASLAAVLNPAETDDLYFVADGTGGHVFSSTLAEHNRNVAKWRRIERERRQ